MPTHESAYIALGANLGDRRRTMREALARLGRLEGVQVDAVSAAYDTPPIGPPDQPRYLNAAAALRTSLPPERLLREMLAIERDLGRDRSGSRWTARIIDLDLILYGTSVRSVECAAGEANHPRAQAGEAPADAASERLELPHPRFRERAFVLVPLAEIAPRARDPVTGEEIESLLQTCPGRAEVIHAGSLVDDE